GSVLTGLVLVPLIGTQGAHRVFIILSATSALVALMPAFRSSLRTLVAFGVLLLGALWVAVNVRPVPAGLIAWGRLLAGMGEPNALYVGEGINSSIAVTGEDNGWRNFHVSGKVEASTEPQDMRLQRLLGHLTMLMATGNDKGPRSALVV